MDDRIIYEGVLSYLCFIIVLTFHEAAHAWTSNRLGDDTARMLGRISLNPAVHIDATGTIFLPMLGIFLGASGSGLSSFVIGWGKPVPVNPGRLKHPLRDGMLIAMAGPLMNVIVALVSIIAVFKVGSILQNEVMMEFGLRLASVSMFLCFFNLIPIPPLDGSHLMRYVFAWGEEAFYNMSRFGFIVLIIILQIPVVRYALGLATDISMRWMLGLVGF